MNLSLEQLALIAIALFGFMALVNMLSGARAIKRSMGYKSERIRRLIGSTDSARTLAESILNDIADKFPDEVAASKRDVKISDALTPELEKARAYYLSRVEPVYKVLFHESVDKIILQKKTL